MLSEPKPNQGSSLVVNPRKEETRLKTPNNLSASTIHNQDPAFRPTHEDGGNESQRSSQQQTNY